VTALDNLARRGSETNIEPFKKEGITFVHGDIRNPEDFYHLKADIILECSAQPSAIDGYNNPKYDISNNLYGAINVLEYARLNGCGVCLWSTNKSYSGDKINAILRVEKDTRYEWSDSAALLDIAGFDPRYGFSDEFSVDGGKHSVYGLTKIQADLACQEYYDAFGVNTVVSRFSCLAGPRQWGKCAQGWVAWFALAAEFGLPVDFIGWKGKQVRDVLFIDDICDWVLKIIQNIDNIGGQVFNIGGGMTTNISLIEAVTLVEKLTGKKITTRVLEEPRKADHCIYISDTRKAKRMLSWQPEISMEQGYEDIIRWVKDNRDILKKLYL
jgi:CDP-paratose 2-epimerase